MIVHITHAHTSGGDRHEHITAVKWKDDGGDTGRAYVSISA